MAPKKSTKHSCKVSILNNDIPDEIHRLLREKLEEKYPDSAQHVGNACYGLQCFSDASAEVRNLVGALAVKVTECRETLDAQAVGNAC